MTREEFGKVAIYLGAGTGKPLNSDALEVYFDCLNDLPYEVLTTAAKRVLMEHKYATFPSIAEMREAAAETQRGEVKTLSPAEAWAIAWRVAANTDPEVDGDFDRQCKRFDVSALVVEAIRSYGLMDLCFGKEPVSVVRGQFLKIFEQLAAREKRHALLPGGLKQQIEQGPKVPLPGADVKRLTSDIGAMP